jgi:hypothetical protein
MSLPITSEFLTAWISEKQLQTLRSNRRSLAALRDDSTELGRGKGATYPDRSSR